MAIVKDLSINVVLKDSKILSLKFFNFWEKVYPVEEIYYSKKKNPWIWIFQFPFKKKNGGKIYKKCTKLDVSGFLFLPFYEDKFFNFSFQIDFIDSFSLKEKKCYSL